MSHDNVHDIVQEAVIKTIPKKKKCKKANWLSEEAWKIAEKKEKQKTNISRNDFKEPKTPFKKPENFDKMIEYSKKLS